MASNTPNLNLYKKDPTIDGNDTFNIKTMLNDNWDKVDTEVAKKANQTDFNSHLANSTSHVTAAERTAWNSKAEKTYVDEQIQTVTATGIPKLVSYEYDLYATTDNQTVFTIPYDYFNSATDTLMVEISGIDVPKSYYTVANPVTNSDKSIAKGYITLNEGRPKDSYLKMRILKNVPIGPDGAISGRVLAVSSIPQDRIENINKIVQYDSDGDIPIYKGKSRPNILPNSTFNFGSLRWSKTNGNGDFTFLALGTLSPSIPSYGDKGFVQYTNSTGSGEYAGLTADPIKIYPGTPLILSGEMFTAGLSSGSAYVSVYAYDKNNNVLSEVCNFYSSTGKDWTKYRSEKGITPANTSYVVVKLFITPNSTNTNTAWRRLKLENVNGELNPAPSPYSQEADILLASNATIQDITYYVDAVNGNDNNDGLNAGYPFKTIGKALSVLPKTINNNVYINIANGTYTETAGIYGFKGCGIININGSGSGCLISNMYVQNCDCLISIVNVVLTTYKAYTSNLDYCLLVTNSRYVYISYITITATDTTKKIYSGAIVVTIGSSAYIAGSTLSNGRSGICCNDVSNVYSSGQAGSGNTYGLSAQNGARIARNGVQPGGITATEILYGGQII